jgi:SAM-dependent methyltransferase
MVEADNTFDAVAQTYEAIRPSYPEALFDAIESYWSDGRSRPRVLEVGVGTGQATLQMAARKWPVFGVEPGAQLAATARSRVASSNLVTVATATFEEVDVADASIDIVASATAWHWVDPKLGYRKAHRVLDRRGAIALWWNAHVPDTTDPRWEPVRSAYERVAPELARLARLTPDRPDYDPVGELHECGLFDAVEQHVFAFEISYAAAEFLQLISTYASHRHLDPLRKQRLYDDLTSTINGELGGTVVKPYEAQLILGRPIR